ncbi:prepilin peptidase [Pectobacterium sp. CHL-2024]|uniref:prepilin peptidase n=1 Tax=Pectobacterium TaxID=122277 RepID=UPI000C1C3CBA|nr:prepilin peptidase [Pectobacterium brasiliense]ATV46114.1 peptidase [Pectobacterium brasiliense]MBA0210493.1 prepilin peptidase [Pectobacterium brasiliense]MCA6982384.1 prepilin peptidase [Pectobacterium brasiliense]MCH4991944.1 prepilin peptidase [Pectobacterium brasiliense]
MKDWIPSHFLLFLFVLGFISWQDIRLRIISHNSLLLLLILILSLAVTQQTLPNFTAALSILLVGYFLFFFNVIGGGDVKLMAVLSLALSNTSLAFFLFCTAFFGGIIAIAGLIIFNDSIRRLGIPYGVAISSAFLFTFLFNMSM